MSNVLTAFLGIVGPSGSGKTTIGRALLKLIPATAGEVIYEGKSILSLSEGEFRSHRRKMQMIFQDPYASLNPRMTILETLLEPMEIHGIGTAETRQDMVAELVTLVGLDRRDLRRYPHSFSGGQRQRIGIARALAVEPQLIVCDEAVSALDVSVQAQVVNLLQDLQRRFNLAYMFIAHDLAVVKHIADRVAVMLNGEKVEEATARQLFESPAHAYTRSLLGASLHHASPDEARALRPAGWGSPSGTPSTCRSSRYDQ